jgi:uncharacterized protein
LVVRDRQFKRDAFFKRASKQWDAGNLLSAFGLFLVGAKAGDSSSQVNLGNFYCSGLGVKPNRARALHWYRRAWRHGERCAASNIGIVFRDERKWKQALDWFERAAKLQDGDANLEIAKIYLRVEKDRAKAMLYLRRTLQTDPRDLTVASRQEAQRLLTRLLKERGRTG